VTLGVADIGGAAPLASPALAGTPTAPTATAGDSTTKLATTAFVAASFLTTATAGSTYAPLASPVLTGTPQAPTPAAGDSSGKIATTGFVTASFVTYAYAGANYATSANASLTGTPTAPTQPQNNNSTRIATTAYADRAAAAIIGRTQVADAAYAVLASDRTVAVTALTAARTLTLPAASAYPAGAALTIVDESGACSATSTVTIAAAGTDTVNGAANAVLAAPYSYLALESNTANKWTVIDGPSGVVSGLNGGPLAGFRNRVINGNFANQPARPGERHGAGGCGLRARPLEGGCRWLHLHVHGRQARHHGHGHGRHADPGDRRCQRRGRHLHAVLDRHRHGAGLSGDRGGVLCREPARGDRPERRGQHHDRVRAWHARQGAIRAGAGRDAVRASADRHGAGALSALLLSTEFGRLGLCGVRGGLCLVRHGRKRLPQVSGADARRTHDNGEQHGSLLRRLVLRGDSRRRLCRRSIGVGKLDCGVGIDSRRSRDVARQQQHGRLRGRQRRTVT